MGNAQKKFPKRTCDRKEEAQQQTPRHNKAGSENGWRREQARRNPLEDEANPEQSSTGDPQADLTSWTGSQGTQLPIKALPTARLKADGNEHFKDGQFTAAADIYSKAIEIVKHAEDRDDEELAILYSNRAACHLKNGNSSECIEDCNNALEVKPFCIKPLLRRAMAYESLERYRQAYVDYKVALQLDSSMQLANDSINRITKTLIDLDGSGWREKLPPIPSVPLDIQMEQQEKRAASAKTSNNTKAKGISSQERFLSLKQEGNYYVKKSQFKEAVRKYTECLQINPEECTIYTNRALCYLKLCQYEEARHDCDCALQKDPSNIKALYRRAQAYKGLENYQDCASDLQKVISLDSGVTEANNLLVEITPLLCNGIKANGQEKQRKKILIQEVNEQEENPSSDDIHSEHGRERTQITKPSNAHEFEQLMTEIRARKDREGCAHLLSLIDPEDLPVFLGNKLDAETLVLITQSLKQHTLEENPSLVFQHLSQLSTSQRFTVVLSFLSSTEKEDVHSLVHLLEQQYEDQDPAVMSSLADQYRL